MNSQIQFETNGLRVLVVGSSLTVNADIIDISGNIILAKGQAVVVRDIEYSGGYYSKFFQMYEPKKISMVKLVDVYGSWNIRIFEGQFTA